MTSTSSMASTPTLVVRVPPARTVGRRHRRTARVTEPAAMASSVRASNSTSRRQQEDGDPVAEGGEDDERVEHLVVAEHRVATGSDA